jgi:hypothetical protein
MFAFSMKSITSLLDGYCEPQISSAKPRLPEA